MLRDYVYRVLGWCPKKSLESSPMKAPKKFKISREHMGIFFGLFLIVSVGIYGLWNAYINSAEINKKGMQIIHRGYGSRSDIIYYDNDLPQDLDYLNLVSYVLHFSEYFEDSWFAKGSSMEQTKLQFNSTLDIKTWLGTVKMPNIVRNTVKALLDVNVSKIRTLFVVQDFIDTPMIFWYGRFDSADGGNTCYWLLFYEDDYSYTLNLRCNWPQMRAVIYDVFIRIPYDGNDYAVILNRIPKT